MKTSMLKGRQDGFTLLELLVVISLLAVLAVGALVAYDGVGANAENTAAAYNISAATDALRASKAVSGNYPAQWDMIVLNDGNEPCYTGDKNDDGSTRANCGGSTGVTGDRLLASASRNFLTKVNLGVMGAAVTSTTDSETDASGLRKAIQEAFDAAGMAEVQALTANPATTVDANLVFNEGANPTGAAELDFDDNAGVVNAMYVYKSNAGGNGCTLNGASIATPLAGAAQAATDSSALNQLNDGLESDACHLVAVLGLGHDVAGQSLSKSVGLASSPVYTSADVNPANLYGRYYGLFHLGTATGGTSANAFKPSDINESARLIALIDPEGKGIDKALNNAFASK